MSKLNKTRRGSRSSVSEVTSTITENEGKDNENNNKDTLKPVVVLESSKSDLTKIPEDSLETNETETVSESDQDKNENAEETKNCEKLQENSQNESLTEPLVYESDTTESELEKLSMEVSSELERPASPILNSQKTSRSKTKETVDTDVKLSQQTSVILELMNDNNEESANTKNDLEIQETVTKIEQTVTVHETVEIVQVHVPEELTQEENVENNTDDSDDVKTVDEDASEQQKLTNGDDDTHSTIDGESISLLDNVSTAVNYSDNTRYIDNTVSDDNQSINTSTDSRNSFVEQTRDLSYIKTLKIISGRKNLHDLRQRSFYNIRKTQDIGNTNGEFYQNDGRALKRKYDDSYTTEDDYVKRSKVDTADDSGLFFSYVASPINKLKTRFSKSRQSTPIKNIDYQNRYYNEDYNHQTINSDEKPNKWCTIQ